MEFSSPEYWSGEPVPSPGDLPNQMQVDSLPTEPQGKPTERTKDEAKEALGFSSSPSFKFLKPPFSCF